MNAEDVMRIKELIKKAQEESLKAQGAIDSMKKGWKDEYGTDDVSELEKKLEEMEEKLNALVERKDIVSKELENACDWNALNDKLRMKP